MRSRSTARLWRQVALHALLTPLALLWLFPLWMMVVFSTLPENGIFSPEIRLLPGPEFRTNFQALQAETGFLRTLFVSVVVALVTTAVSVMLTSMAGWALVRYRFRGRWLVIALIFGTLTLPYFVVVIPQFIMVARDMGLSNTWFALIVPPLFNSLGVLFMRQAFTMMPADLFDAAQVEGVSEWRIFTRVALPMARPTHRGALPSSCSWPRGTTTFGRSSIAIGPVDDDRRPWRSGTLIGFTRVSWGLDHDGARCCLTLPMLWSSSSFSASSCPASPRAPSNEVLMAGVTLRGVRKAYRAGRDDPRRRTSTWRTASSWSSWAPRAAASPRSCA
jgi:lactose/L-arabinose transport system permease protein